MCTSTCSAGLLSARVEVSTSTRYQDTGSLFAEHPLQKAEAADEIV